MTVGGGRMRLAPRHFLVAPCRAGKDLVGVRYALHDFPNDAAEAPTVAPSPPARESCATEPAAAQVAKQLVCVVQPRLVGGFPRPGARLGSEVVAEPYVDVAVFAFSLTVPGPGRPS